MFCREPAGLLEYRRLILATHWQQPEIELEEEEAAAAAAKTCLDAIQILQN